MEKNLIDPGFFCRLDDNVIADVKEGKNTQYIAVRAILAIIACSALYGASLGLWRSYEQAFYGAIKMPVLILSVVLASGAINVMLAQALGSGLTARQVFVSVLLSLSIASILLGSLSPVMLFLVLQSQGPQSQDSMSAYWALLIINTAVVGICGILGCVKLRLLLKNTVKNPAMADKILLLWILISGFAGCQLSWLISPFLARPDRPVPFFNPLAFQSNFYEYLWNGFVHLFREASGF